jgi:NCS1 family nucleobase:cation symporter-1
MMLILAIGLVIKAGGISFTSSIPTDVLIEKTKDAGVPGVPGSLASLGAVAATWITYFAALYLNFCDFSRYAPNVQAVRTGNLWGLPVNLILFSLVAGVTTIAAYQVYGEALVHPDQISAKFDSWILALIAAITFAVATLGINVVANFVSPAFDFSNVFPSMIDFKRGGYIAALIALVLYPFAPWEGSAASFVGLIGATMGPIFGVMMVDYYLINKGVVDVPALYQEHGVYRYSNGFNWAAIVAAVIGALFSSILPNFTSILPDWWGVYGWFFGVAIGGGVYYLVRPILAASPSPAPAGRTGRG